MYRVNSRKDLRGRKLHFFMPLLVLLLLLLSGGAGLLVTSHMGRAHASSADSYSLVEGGAGGGGALAGAGLGDGGGDIGDGSGDLLGGTVNEYVPDATNAPEIQPGASMVEYTNINGTDYQYDPDTQSMTAVTTNAQGTDVTTIDPQQDAQTYNQVQADLQQDDANSESVKALVGTVNTQTTVDLFRMGNSSGPKLVTERAPRIGVDIYPDENGMIAPGQGESSTFERMNKPAKWWQLPAGTQLPDGLQVRNDTPGHWLIEPSRSMSVEEFRQLLLQITGWQPVN
jgi:hypothetical protein